MISILDLFCGGGGASVGMYNACDCNAFIVGVDIENKEYEYPFYFWQKDVFDIPLKFFDMFDFIWASPPCQHYSIATIKNKDSYPDLYLKTRTLLLNLHKPFVIENVPGSPIRKDLELNGLMFNLRVRKLRYFEINGFYVVQLKKPTKKGKVKNGDLVTTCGHGCDGTARLSEWKDALGINWMHERKSLANAIPPSYSEYIFRNYLTQKKIKNQEVIVK
jgi:DNA (cytosine-5)-methyltransferase 1